MAGQHSFVDLGAPVDVRRERASEGDGEKGYT